jgi:lycopene beta-cyclase
MAEQELADQRLAGSRLRDGERISPVRTRCDVAFVGTGLANALIALRLSETRPDLRLRAFDRLQRVGEARTWSLFASDIDEAQRAWIAPYVAYAWPAYEVRFPGLTRVFDTGYMTLDTAAIDAAVQRRLGAGFERGREVRDLRPDGITLDGETVDATVVFDGRGARRTRAIRYGWQKFVGRELLLDAPHGVVNPIIMDACVEQRDGFRFLYVLPLAPDRLMLEDTRYSDTPLVEPQGFRDGIDRYAARNGWRVREVLAEEQGALPVTLAGDIDAFWRELPAGIAPTGMRAALAHPTTGYSVPSAMRLADAIAAAPPADGVAARCMVAAASAAAWQRHGFYRFLNRMLFQAGPPDQRWRILRHFHKKPEPLIRRFYAGQSRMTDKINILAGRPPAPIVPALRCLNPGSVSVPPGDG